MAMRLTNVICRLYYVVRFRAFTQPNGYSFHHRGCFSFFFGVGSHFLGPTVLGQVYIQVAIMIRKAFAAGPVTRAGLLERNVPGSNSGELGEEFKLPKMASLVIVIAYNTMLQVRGYYTIVLAVCMA